MVSRAEKIQSRLRWLWSKRGFRRAAIILGVIFIVPDLLFGFFQANGEDKTLASGDVNDFEFESFDANYRLSLEQDGLSVLRVKETLVALFPERDQNRGLFRYIPDRYEGAPLNTEVLSLVDEAGLPRPLDAYLEGDFVVVDTAVSEGSFLRGRQSFVLDYSQSNVLREFADGGIWEFYWDVNGTGWLQPFQTVSASVEIDPSLAEDLLTDRMHCYFGEYGSDQKCPITIEKSGAGYIVRAQADNLGPGETLTIALGFSADSGVQVEEHQDAPWVGIASWILFGLLVGAALPSAAIFRIRRLRHQGPIRQSNPEYLPPKDLDLEMAALLLKKPGAVMTSKLLQLAVDKKARLIEFEEGKWGVSLERSDLPEEDAEFLQAILGKVPPVGAIAALPTSPTDLGSNFSGYTKASNAEFTELYLRNVSRKSRVLRILPAVCISMALFTIGFIGLALFQPEDPTGVVLTFPAVFVTAIIGFLASKRPLNLAGSEKLQKLSGLKVYMKLAEEERIAILQSPEGAIRRGDARYLVLHERLLPWAVLLGLAEDWAKELDVLSPTAAGSGIVHSTSHGTFSDSLRSFDSSVSGSMGSSSGGGGSGGGGGAGGGGGGGGGGGQ